ncbi:unnamed protein product, partial [Polarella glacialis]
GLRRSISTPASQAFGARSGHVGRHEKVLAASHSGQRPTEEQPKRWEVKGLRPASALRPRPLTSVPSSPCSLVPPLSPLSPLSPPHTPASGRPLSAVRAFFAARSPAAGRSPEGIRSSASLRSPVAAMKTPPSRPSSGFTHRSPALRRSPGSAFRSPAASPVPSGASDMTPAESPVSSPGLSRQVSYESPAAKLLFPDLDAQALFLARRHKLEFYEVKMILQALHNSSLNEAGGMDIEDFSKFFTCAFDIPCVEEKLLDGAYRESEAAKGPFCIHKFFDWYKANLFSLIVPMTSSAERVESDRMVESLAKRCKVSVVEIDRIKTKFDSFDVDKSGEIEFPEFVSMMRTLMRVNQESDFPKVRLARFWQEIDHDGSGAVDFEEFAEWYIRYFSGEGLAGPLETFYASHMPDLQRKNNVKALQEAWANPSV